MEEEDGTTEGPCPFIVHGLTGEEFSTKTMKTIKAIALRHLTSEGKILAIGHAEIPESIYGNPQLFPSMLPWLFSYGLGGIGQTEHKHKLSSMMHKRHLLMYYDKRFQKDPHFPLIAFNHEQMKESTTAGYLTAERKSFDDITDRLICILHSPTPSHGVLMDSMECSWSAHGVLMELPICVREVMYKFLC